MLSGGDCKHFKFINMSYPCATCFVENQTLTYSIDADLLQILYNLLQPVTVNNLITTQTRICYGCQARLQQMNEFRNMALESLKMLYKEDLIIPILTNNVDKTAADVEYSIYTHYYNPHNYNPQDSTQCNNNTLEPSEYNIETLGMESDVALEHGSESMGTNAETLYAVDGDNNSRNKYVPTVPKKKPLMKALPPADLVGSKIEVQPLSSDHDYTEAETADETGPTRPDEDMRPTDVTSQLWYIKSLSNDEMLSKMADKRRRPEFQSAPHKCKLCVIVFRNKEQAKSHAKDCHEQPTGRFECFICTRRFTTLVHMNRHVSLHCAQVYVCAQCGYDTYDRRAIQRHACRVSTAKRKRKLNTATKTNIEKLECKKCYKSFKSRAGFASHTDLCKEVQPREKCKICNKTFKNSHRLKSHLKLQHTDTPNETDSTVHRCEPCDSTFSSAVGLRYHLKSSQKHVSREDFKYACDQCEMKFYYQRTLDQHKNVVHLKLKPFTCFQCNKSFAVKRALKNHTESVHGHNERPRKYPCDVCGAAFLTKKTLTQHERRHTGDRPFQCDQCEDTFSYSGALHTHKALKHIIPVTSGEIPYQTSKASEEEESILS